MAEKVTTMVLNVDLQCYRCYKKVKKVLCKFPQIRDQMYDMQANTVTITVVCCSPEKIRDKIRSKGGKSIKSIEIKPPPKPKEPEKKPEKPKEPEKKKPKDRDEIKPPPKPKKKPPEPDPMPAEPEKKPELRREPNNLDDNIKDPEKKPETKTSQKPEALTPPPQIAYPPIGFYSTERYHGHDGGPYYFSGPPPPSGPCYGRPVYDSWGGDGDYQHYYASEENPQGCLIM